MWWLRVPRRATAAATERGRPLRRSRSPTVSRQARNHGPLASERQVNAVLGGVGPPRPLLRGELDPLGGRGNPGEDSKGGGRAGWNRTLTSADSPREAE